MVSRGKILKDIGDDVCGDHPGFTMAVKDEVVQVLEEYTDRTKWPLSSGFKYKCRDINNEYDSYYVSENEITIEDK